MPPRYSWFLSQLKQQILYSPSIVQFRAIFAITTDPFIVFTSNIFAILGLRALYFLLAGMIGKFRYLKVGLGLVLAFVGAKMLLADWIHFPIVLSLGIVAGLLGLSVAASLLFPAERSANNSSTI